MHFLKIIASQCTCVTDTSCFAKRKKNTENIKQISSTSNGRVMILSKCAICGSKKSRFIKHQEAKGLLSELSIKTALSKIAILGGILF